MNIAWIAIGTAVYLYFAWCLQIIGNKTRVGDAWLAWVPVVNLYYMVRIAGRGPAWFLLLWVPIVNLYALTVIWNDIIERRRGAPSRAGVLMLVPVLNYMILTRLAFADEPVSVAATA